MSVNLKNPYFIAIFTALLAGFFSFIGTWYTAGKQYENILLEERLNSRRIAYHNFLEKIDRMDSPEISKFLHIGTAIDNLIVDAQYQALEDQFEIMVKNLYDYSIYWKLSSDLSLLRLYASDKVNQYADDLLSVLTIVAPEIELSNYPVGFVEFWKANMESQCKYSFYAITEKVQCEERVIIIAAAEIFNLMVNEMRNELMQVPLSR